MSRRRRLLLAGALAAAVAIGVAVAVLARGGDDEQEGKPPARTAPATEEREERRGGGPGVPDGGQPEGHRDTGGGEALDGAVKGAGGRQLAVGLGDQNLDMFSDPRFRRLGLRHARLVAPWNAALTERRELRSWVDAALAAGAEPLIAFNGARGSECPANPCEAPTAGEFERAFRAMRARFPEVDTFSTWNEPNHASQPVVRRPELVARFYRIIREVCPDCTVLAADVVGDHGARGFVRAFERAAGEHPRLWGLHNYPDTNRFRSSGTRAFLGVVRGRVWITETGGIVEFTTRSGRASFPYDEERAARATRHMVRVARSDPRIERLYVYQWRKTAPTDRFDAGLIGPDGRERPAYDVLRREIAR